MFPKNISSLEKKDFYIERDKIDLIIENISIEISEKLNNQFYSTLRKIEKSGGQTMDPKNIHAKEKEEK